MTNSRLQAISSLSIRFLIGGIIVALLLAIFMYNQMVTSRAQATQITEQAESLRLENAELKNALYTLLDSQQLITAADRLGLIKESRPRYLTLEGEREFIDIASALAQSRQAKGSTQAQPVRLIATYLRQ